jgi:hypothetical protein
LNTAAGPVILDPKGRPIAKIPEKYRNATIYHHFIRLMAMGYSYEGARALVWEMNLRQTETPISEHEFESTICKTALKKVASQPPLRVVVPMRFHGLLEFLDWQPEDDEPYLIQGILPERGWATLLSRPKTGKSLTLHQIAFEAAIGRPVFGTFRVRPGIRAAYVDFEQSRAETKKRMKLMAPAYPDLALETADGFFLMTQDDIHEFHMFTHEVAELGNPHRTEFAELLAEKKINLLCLATMRTLVKGGQNLKDQEIAEAFNEWVTWLRGVMEITVIVAHHSRKGMGKTEQEAFGSTMLTAAPDANFILKREGSFNRFITEGAARFSVTPDFLLGLVPGQYDNRAIPGSSLLRVIEDPDRVLTDRIMELHAHGGKEGKGMSTRDIAREPGIGLSHNAVAERIKDEEAARKAAEEAQPALAWGV